MNEKKKTKQKTVAKIRTIYENSTQAQCFLSGMRAIFLRAFLLSIVVIKVTTLWIPKSIRKITNKFSHHFWTIAMNPNNYLLSFVHE